MVRGGGSELMALEVMRKENSTEFCNCGRSRCPAKKGTTASGQVVVSLLRHRADSLQGEYKREVPKDNADSLPAPCRNSFNSDAPTDTVGICDNITNGIGQCHWIMKMRMTADKTVNTCKIVTS